MSAEGTRQPMAWGTNHTRRSFTHSTFKSTTTPDAYKGHLSLSNNSFISLSSRSEQNRQSKSSTTKSTSYSSFHFLSLSVPLFSGSTIMPAPTTAPRTLYDKVFDDHVVYSGEGDTLIYIDRHLVHEVTSPQAFEGLETAGRPVRRPDNTLATVDHNIP